MSLSLRVEQAGSADTGKCQCCGRTSRCVWGYVHSGQGALAAYFVHWTLGHVSDRGANIDLIIGRWGDSTNSDDRCAVSLAYRRLDTGPSFMVLDAATRDIAKNSLVGRALARTQVIGQPIADDVFAVCDAVWLQDPRITELHDKASQA